MGLANKVFPSLYIPGSFQTSFTPLLSGPIWPMVDTFLAAMITKSECTGRLSFAWKLKKRYFPSVVDTRLEPSPGKITVWNGLIEDRITSPSIVTIIPMYYTTLLWLSSSKPKFSNMTISRSAQAPEASSSRNPVPHNTVLPKIRILKSRRQAVKFF